MYVCNVLCCFAVMCCVRTDDAMNKEWRYTATDNTIMSNAHASDRGYVRNSGRGGFRRTCVYI